MASVRELTFGSELKKALQSGEVVQCSHPDFTDVKFYFKLLSTGALAYVNAPYGYVLPEKIGDLLKDLGFNQTINSAIKARRDSSGVLLLDQLKVPQEFHDEIEIVNLLENEAKKAATVKEAKAAVVQEIQTTSKKPTGIFARFFKSESPKESSIAQSTTERKPPSGPRGGVGGG